MENDSLMARAVKIGMNEIKARLELIEKYQQKVKEVLEQSAIRVVSSAYLRLLIFLLAILIPACASSSPAFL